MPASADCSPMRSSRPSSLFACSATSSGMPASAIFVRYSSTIDRGVLAQLALDRLHLLAQEVLALLLVGAVADVLADLPAQLQLDEPLALDLHGELEPLGDVERLEHLDLLLEGDVGRVADRVGQRAGLDDRAQELRDALVGAAELEDLLDHGAVLALGVAGAAVDGDVVGDLGHLDAEAAGGVGVRGARDAAGDAGERHGAPAAGEADAVGDLGDRADLGELTLVARDQQHALLVARVDGEGHIHGGEDDGVVEGEEQERGHTREAFSAIAAYESCVNVAARPRLQALRRRHLSWPD